MAPRRERRGWRARDELLADARLALEQDRDVGRGDLAHAVQHARAARGCRRGCRTVPEAPAGPSGAREETPKVRAPGRPGVNAPVRRRGRRAARQRRSPAAGRAGRSDAPRGRWLGERRPGEEAAAQRRALVAAVTSTRRVVARAERHGAASGPVEDDHVVAVGAAAELRVGALRAALDEDGLDPPDAREVAREARRVLAAR